MAWSRLQYLCRQINSAEDDEPPAQRMSRLNNEPSTNLYGKFEASSVAGKIFEKIKSINDAQIQRDAILAYQNMFVADLFQESKIFKRVVVYLSYVAAVYILVSLLMSLRVIPQFIETFESFNQGLPAITVFYYQYNLYVSSLCAGLMLLSLWAAWSILKLSRLQQCYSLKPLFIPRKLFAQYQDILALVHFPLEGVSTCADEILSTHLQSLKGDAVAQSVEIRALLAHQMTRFSHSCEFYMRFLYTLCGVVLVFSIMLFLYSVYAPIFEIGSYVI